MSIRRKLPPSAVMIEEGEDGFACQRGDLRMIVSWGMGWEHVSASLPHRCPTWEEMCRIKGWFWEPEDVVMQLHPRESQYVNLARYCLHLWRPTEHVIPEPPSIFVLCKKRWRS